MSGGKAKMLFWAVGHGGEGARDSFVPGGFVPARPFVGSRASHGCESRVDGVKRKKEIFNAGVVELIESFSAIR